MRPREIKINQNLKQLKDMEIKIKWELEDPVWITEAHLINNKDSILFLSMVHHHPWWVEEEEAMVAFKDSLHPMVNRCINLQCITNLNLDTELLQEAMVLLKAMAYLTWEWINTHLQSHHHSSQWLHHMEWLCRELQFLVLDKEDNIQLQVFLAKLVSTSLEQLTNNHWAFQT